MDSPFAHLNQSDTLLPSSSDSDTGAEVACRRVLARLGEYSELAIRPLNMRPRSSRLLRHDPERVEVRVSSDGAHVLLVIAPDGDLSAEQFFLKALAGRNLPFPRVIAADLSRQALPFDFLIESYIGGQSLSLLNDPTMIRAAARQLGRALRRIHQTPAPAFGKPSASGRWPSADWTTTLIAWLGQRNILTQLEQLCGPNLRAELYHSAISHPNLQIETPRVIHSRPNPARTIVTVGEHAQLEALIRPGDLVGGDPMFDLAYTQLPHHPEAFRRGVYEGYTAGGALEALDEDRLRRLWLLLLVSNSLERNDPTQLAELPGMIRAELEVLHELS